MKQLTTHCINVDTLLRSQLGRVHAHMEGLGVNSRCFLDGWLLTLMSKVIPLEEMHLVVNSFRNKGWAFMYSLIG